MKVSNMLSNAGNKVANQFIIHGDDGSVTFQSYETVIAKIDNNRKVILDSKAYDYSKTTSKYLNAFLSDQCYMGTINKAKAESYINAGIFDVEDLNK